MSDLRISAPVQSARGSSISKPADRSTSSKRPEAGQSMSAGGVEPTAQRRNRAKTIPAAALVEPGLITSGPGPFAFAPIPGGPAEQVQETLSQYLWPSNGRSKNESQPKSSGGPANTPGTIQLDAQDSNSQDESKRAEESESERVDESQKDEPVEDDEFDASKDSEEQLKARAEELASRYMDDPSILSPPYMKQMKTIKGAKSVAGLKTFVGLTRQDINELPKDDPKRDAKLAFMKWMIRVAKFRIYELNQSLDLPNPPRDVLPSWSELIVANLRAFANKLWGRWS